MPEANLGAAPQRDSRNGPAPKSFEPDNFLTDSADGFFLFILVFGYVECLGAVHSLSVSPS